MGKNPQIERHKTRTERIHDLICVLLFMAILLYLGIQWSALPSEIPIHFDETGKADGWGGKGFTLFIIMIPLVIYIVMTVMAKYPHHFNYPARLSHENAAAMYQNAQLLISWLKLEITLFFIWFSKRFIDAAVYGTPLVVWEEVVLFVGILLLTIGILLYRRNKIK
ncbi:DUF1648 domain-containing protein [Mechercharimyces sp. CAU 1602]|uniref:DUF1648 domain-containing protein n=1 Tax=Mechercharimyces sp. CAU 1602 TaxID=2973933 RepID=UPI0021634881|nr:DUF1648 domain-containing protein [Mechercharimyces sp. CAU 1602]MCS1352293.1 DUF1648 domain-containing protein [Mechercharimyces sp. CAU 1602]